MAIAKLLQQNVGKQSFPLESAFASEETPSKAADLKEALSSIKSSFVGGIKTAMDNGASKIKEAIMAIPSGKDVPSKDGGSDNPFITKFEDKLGSKFSSLKPIIEASRELRGGKGGKDKKQSDDFQKQELDYSKSTLKELTIIRLLVEKIAKVQYDPRAKGAQFKDDKGRFAKLGATGKELKPFGPTMVSPAAVQPAAKAAVEQKKAEQAAAQQQQPAQESESDSGLGLSDMLSAGWKGVKTAGKTIAKGALSLGKGAARFIGTPAGKVLGATAAVGMGAYTAYKGWKTAEGNAEIEKLGVEDDLRNGFITQKEANEKIKAIDEGKTVEKSGAVGSGTGMAAGAIAGAKLGATVGTFIGGPVGTGVGALAGGALGAVAGSSVGKKIGEYGGKAINAIGNFFSSDKEKKQQPNTKAGPNWKQTIKEYEELDSTPVDHLEPQFPGIKKEYIKLAKKIAPRSDSRMSIDIHEEMLKTMALRNVSQGQSSPSEIGTKGQETPKVEMAGDKSSPSTNSGSAAIMGNDVRSEASRLGIDPNKAQGTFEGGVLTKITDRTSGKEYSIEVPEADKRKVEAARTMRAANERSGEIARTSAENAAMEREASKPIVTPIISNNNVQTNRQEMVPIKASPRSESSFTRYMDRAAAW